MTPYQSTPLDEFFITVPGLPSHTQVMEFAEEAVQPADSTPPARYAPLWALVCVLLGSGLTVASGAFLITMGVLL